MNARLKGPWLESQVSSFLEQSVYPLRLACVDPEGVPVVVSVWYLLDNGSLQCVSHQKSHLVRLLRANNRVGFEVAPNEPPYHGVRGQGSARLTPLGERDTLNRLLVRYLGGTDSSLAQWLLSRKAEEVLISIDPTQIFSWDYRQRMADIPAPNSGK
ncbi:pyridoxamine 5'-phosphate oxidase family protein [Parahaliea maris]|uniref:Pyridoxamine 5'-phosphate oxidase family protein n=1 Tax=Parahaliea maris TaxID=2716870 RepID=A0A5C9A4U9_9GAMM|nr:pyridoxamine 5'-phosphate oxidase family protein [Parahaliea maris]TXS95963.1 pyridoxamine 5'-phosphate oxidase family protein [Parahaliea maris]